MLTKKYYFLLGIILLSTYVSAQEYQIKKKNYNTYYARAAVLSKNEICFPGYNKSINRPVIDFLKDGKKEVQSVIIGENWNYEKLFYLLLRKDVNVYYVVSQGFRNDSSFIVTSTLVLDGTQNIIDEKLLGNAYTYNGASYFFNGENYLGTIISMGKFEEIEEFIFLKLRNDNTVDWTKVSKKDAPSKIFNISLIVDAEMIGENRLLFKGRSFDYGIMDTLLNIISIKNTINGKNYFGGNFYKSPDQTYYMSTLLLKNNFKRALISAKVISDKLVADIPFIYDDANSDVYSNPIICGVDKTIFCGFTKYRVTGAKQFPSQIFISGFNGKLHTWSKSYGGDYYLSLFDILIFNNKIYASGSIHDYFGNDKDQGFYFILDMDGKLLTSSLDIHEISAVKVYPNPTSDYIILDSDYNKDVKFKLYNTLGQEIFATKSKMSKSRIDLPKALEGNYFYKILDLDGGLLDSGKLILE